MQLTHAGIGASLHTPLPSHGSPGVTGSKSHALLAQLSAVQSLSSSQPASTVHAKHWPRPPPWLSSQAGAPGSQPKSVAPALALSMQVTHAPPVSKTPLSSHEEPSPTSPCVHALLAEHRSVVQSSPSSP